MPQPESKRPSRSLYWGLAMLVVAVALFAVRSFTSERISVRTARVSRQTLLSTVSTNGKVEPIEQFQAHAPQAGVVQKIYVNVGDKVRAGQMLVRMDDSDARARLATASATLTAAQLTQQDLSKGGTLEERNRFSSQLASAKLDQQQAQDGLKAVQALQAKGAASAGEVTRAEQRLHAADAAVASASTSSTSRYGADDRNNAQARVADAKAGVMAAASSLSGINIRSPLSGTVYSLPVSEYDFVPAGEDLLDVANLNHIQVRAYFDEPEVGKLARGQAVKIVWDAKPDTAWHGHIAIVPTTIITYGTRNVGECLVTVDDARGDLLPNTNVTVTVTEAQRPDVLSIPREALHTDGAMNFVYRIVDGKLTRTSVTVGVVNLTSVEITSGLSDNDLVVLGPAAAGKELADGLAVKQVG